MAMEQNLIKTRVCPRNFAEAAERHGRHFARYLFAGRMATGKRVLDGACGSGYGSAYLATMAQSVIGVDINENLLKLAESRFKADNLRFLKHDLHEPIEGVGTFNLICSFETLEHVRRPEICLANLAFALDSGGTAIISVPNGTKERMAGGKEYHPNQFSARDFEDLLNSRFEEVQLFSQVYRKGIGHYIRKLTARSARHAYYYRFVPTLLDSAKTWLAICQKPYRK